MDEPLPYRAKKWMLQQLSTGRASTQLQRLDETDWDILLVLDACGVDALRTAADWPVETVRSPASCTPEWLDAVDRSGVFETAHVVSANAQYTKSNPAEILERYWESHWDDDLSTVRPEPVLDRVDSLAGERPTVAHLQQPHWPYVAKLGQRWKRAYPDLGPWSTEKGDIDSLQVAMARGHIDIPMAHQAYQASVRSIWETIRPYLNRWDEESRTVIVTADHGETFGRLKELMFYEHPCRCHIPPLVHVPWIEVTQDTPAERTESTVEDRLKALGYAE